MAVTINWLLAQKDMPGFSLVAGDTTECPPISGINIMDNPSTAPWLSPGTLVLSTGYLLLKGDLAKHIVTDLKQRKCCALGIKMNRYIKSLPEEMKTQADKLHFPIINIPFFSNMSQIGSLVYKHIYEEEINETQHFSIAYKNICERILKKRPFSELLNIISDTLKASVFLTSENFEVTDHQIYDSTLMPASFRIPENGHKIFSETDIKKFLQEEKDISLPIITQEIRRDPEVLTFQIIPIKDLRHLIGHLIILNLPFEMNGAMLEFLINLKSALGLAIISRKDTDTEEETSHSTFLNGILSHKTEGEIQLENACTESSFDFHLNRICLVAKSKAYEDLSVSRKRFAERKAAAESEEILRLYPAIEYAFTIYQEAFVVFILFRDRMNEHDYSDFCAGIAACLAKGLENMSLPCIIGISKPESGLRTIASGYEQAMQALEIGKQLDKDKTIFSYCSNQIYHELLNHFSHEELFDLYRRLLGNLDSYDREHHTELTKTLKVYIDNTGNMTTSAEKLFIHRNTMMYRMKQIKALLGIDPENEDSLYMLKTAYYIKRLLPIL